MEHHFKSIVSNLADAVEGTKTLAQAAVNVLNRLKRALIELAIEQAVSGIGGKIGNVLTRAFGVEKKAARGGFVRAGTTTLVGERGPEIFTPRSSGMVTANDKISLGGGGTDLPSYYRIKEGFLLCAAINQYVYCNVTKPFEKGIYLKYSEIEMLILIINQFI